MDANQDNATREQPAAEEKAAPSGNGHGRHSRRRGPRRPRFRRGHRGNRGDHGPEHSHASELSKEPGSAQPGSHASIRTVIEQVEQIRGELEKALDDIHEALHTLEQVEREKTASEEEIETLRETLKQLQHGQGNSRQARYPAQKPTGTTAHEESDSDIERETD